MAGCRRTSHRGQGWGGIAPAITVALIAILASGCGSTLTQTPNTSQTPAATPASATLASPVPGILVQPSTPIPLPAEATLSAPSSDVVWVLVESMFLYRSTNRGTTWQQRPIPPGNFPGPGISFIDDQQGWFATGGVPETQCNGAGTVLWHTADAGDTWQQVASVDWQHQVLGGIGYGQCKEGLSFVDAMHGFLGAWDPNHRPSIYATADGGFTWASSTLPDPPGFVTQGAGDALRPGLAKGFGKTLLIPAWGMQPGAQMETEYIFRSVDGGTTWNYLATAGQGINNVTFVVESRWLKISNNGLALETTDAGKTWRSYPSDYQDAAGVPSIFVFGDPLVGYGTVRGAIRRTIDGGLHWVLIKTPGVNQPG
jgi:photosystem II stability/assembly factor-like uncharacterized protein